MQPEPLHHRRMQEIAAAELRKGIGETSGSFNIYGLNCFQSPMHEFGESSEYLPTSRPKE